MKEFISTIADCYTFVIALLLVINIFDIDIQKGPIDIILCMFGPVAIAGVITWIKNKIDEFE